MCNKILNYDTQKLHAENGQLRNQQFQITLSSLAFFGVANGWITSSHEPNKECLITVCLLVLLGVLFFWSRILKNLIDEISIYLKIRKMSHWEYDYREYSHYKKIGQTSFSSLVYIVLGIVSLTFFFIDNKNVIEINDINFWLPLWFCVAYTIFVAVFGFFIPIYKEEDKKEKWEKAIKKADLKFKKQSLE
jgi:hypothetical protein